MTKGQLIEEVAQYATALSRALGMYAEVRTKLLHAEAARDRLLGACEKALGFCFGQWSGWIR